jgi:peptidoglycan/xylan/chitin deacetylase (PgdA/CDA1 family)
LKLYTITPPQWLKLLYGRGFLWAVKTNNKEVYLTFDDGPQPGVTNWVLDLLKEYNAKATFFCIGHNVAQYPELYARIQAEGHTIGNHTYNHINGLKSTNAVYFTNIQKAKELIDSHLFRPPYGKLRWWQARWVKRHFKPVMWSVLAADWDQAVTPEECFANVASNTTNGAIIVFHDSLKAETNLRATLPKYLAFLKANGYVACSLY